MCFWPYCTGDKHQRQLRRNFFLKSAAKRAGSAGRTFWPKKCDLGSGKQPKNCDLSEKQVKNCDLDFFLEFF